MGYYLCMGTHQGAGMSTFKRLICWKLIIKLVLMSVLSTPVYATKWVFDENGNVTGTVPDATYERNKLNAALSGTTQQALASRGYSQSDPRVTATLFNMSNAGKVVAGAAGTVAAVVVGGVTAPAWGSVLLTAAASAVIGTVISIGVGAAWDWLFGSDQSITTQQITNIYQAPAMEQGQPYWSCSNFRGASPQVVFSCFEYDKATNPSTYGNIHLGDCKFIASGTMYQCNQLTQSNSIWGSYNSGLVSSGAPNSCPIGQVYKVSAAQCVPATAPPAVAPVKSNLNAAVQAIPAADLAKPLNPQVVAATANTLWQQAASQPGYDGVPFPQSNPISTEEAQNWIANNPDWAPTVGDFVAPNPDIAGQPSGSQWQLPTNASQSGSPSTINPAPTGSTQVNLGPDPVIGAPSLETPPTAQQIVNPVLNALPQFKNFQAVSHAGACPKPEFEFFGHQRMEVHCTLIDNNKSTLQVAMTFTWALIALLIVLSA